MLTLANGRFTIGGSIPNQGTLRVESSTFLNDSAEAGGRGGAIQDDSTADLTVSDGRFRPNTAASGGGAIQNNGGTATLDRSTLSVNFANDGAGIELNGGSFDANRTTCLGNDATNQAGAFFHANTSTLVAKNTIFSVFLFPGTRTPQPNCDGSPMTSQGNNLSSDDSCNLISTGDKRATNPNLGPIANDGGPTQTHRPLAGSPVIYAGTNTGCPAVDPRGAVRPQTAGAGA